jgi:hypothetical protein
MIPSLALQTHASAALPKLAKLQSRQVSGPTVRRHADGHGRQALISWEASTR